MALWIQNVTEGDRSDDELHDYVVRINHNPPLAAFKHVRSRGAAACLRAAADAIADDRGEESKLFSYLAHGGDALALAQASLEHALGYLGIEIEENKKLRGERAELIEALRPFADAASKYDPVEDDDNYWSWDTETIRIGWLRRARALIERLCAVVRG